MTHRRAMAGLPAMEVLVESVAWGPWRVGWIHRDPRLPKDLSSSPSWER